MKPLFIASVFLLVGLSGSAYAACPATGGTRLNATQLDTELSGKMVCATLGSDKWQEELLVGGQLWDWKLGPTNAVDPRIQVGTWSIQGTGGSATIRFSYTGGASYDYAVDMTSTTTFDFCGATNVTGATVKATGSACP